MSGDTSSGRAGAGAPGASDGAGASERGGGTGPAAAAALLVDVGVNFAGKQYKGPGVVGRLLAESTSGGVGAVISISNSMAEAGINAGLSREHEPLYCTAGVHPHAAKSGIHDGLRCRPLPVRSTLPLLAAGK